MDFPKEVVVTGQTIDLSGLSGVQQSYFIDVANSLNKIYQSKGRGRQVFFIAGPGGSGKSVLVAIIEQLLKEADYRLIKNGIDAFHFNNKFLQEKGLIEFKGRNDTYDAVQIKQKLSEFKSGGTVQLPTYSRQQHQPVPNSITIHQEESDVLWLFEGGWLLYNDPIWKDLRDYAGYTVFLAGPAQELRQNVIKRHITGGRSRSNAKEFYTNSDQKNAQMILENSVGSDLKLSYFGSL